MLSCTSVDVMYRDVLSLFSLVFQCLQNTYHKIIRWTEKEQCNNWISKIKHCYSRIFVTLLYYG